MTARAPLDSRGSRRPGGRGGPLRVLLALLPLGAAFAHSEATHAAPPIAVGQRGARAEDNPAATLAGPRWTDETPDAMIDRAVERALAPAAPEHTVLGAIAIVYALSDRAPHGHARRALDRVAGAPGVAADLRAEASLLSRTLAPDLRTEAGAAADRALGVVTELRVLGPFRDAGGGLDKPDGPEAPPARGAPLAAFVDPHARHSWGSYDVAWRAIPRTYASAQGAPLDVFVHPRRESCTWVASTVRVADGRPFVVRLAASGQVRLMVDGALAGKSDDAHAAARFDRLAARVEGAAGPHLVAAKVCSGALGDEGRVRLRLTDEAGAPLALPASADLEAPRGKAAKIQPVTTPLQRVLSGSAGVAAPPARTRVAAGPAADTAPLDAAIVRTLGGADDQKSPRAPGMLATMASDVAIPADRLAAVAWIAPSGSNRSGWLNLAESRAQATGDTRTRAFVERSLIATRVSGRLSDWAMATRRHLKLDAAGDGEAALLCATVDEAMGNEALHLAAVRRLARAVDGAPDAAPSAVVRELAHLSFSTDPARALAARELLARRGERGHATVEALWARGARPMEVAARGVFDGALDDADEGIATARALSRAGAHEASRDLFAKLVQWAPNRAESWSGLADEMTAVARAGEGTELAATVSAALRRARALAPGEARTRALLALRQRPEPADDESYLVSSDTLLARRLGVPKGVPDIADRQLYWLRAAMMHADKRVSQLIHYAREIVIAPRTQEELVEELPAEGELTEILRARVHHRDGTFAFPAEEHNEGTRPRIRWPELVAGDTVEVAVRTWTAGPVGGRGDPPFYFLDYAGSLATHPLLYNEVIVAAPKDTPIHVDVLSGQPDRRVEKEEHGRHVVRLIWERPVAIPEEPLAPNVSELVPMIVGSTFKDWGEFRAWYGEAVKGFTTPDDEVRRLAAELTKGKATREAKVSALFNFVADQIRYVNYVSGEWWLPNRPQQLLARREGDCDDKAILLITLLKAVGIEAQEVMVQTRLTGQPSILLGKGAAIPLFDHGIAFLPGPNGGTYLDATSPQSRLGPLPSMDARAVALRMDAGPAEIVRLPTSGPESHGATIDWQVRLQADGAGELVGEERHAGDGAFWLRTYLTEAGARHEYVEGRLVAGWFPTVEVDKTIEFKGDLPEGQAWVRYRARSEGLARKEQGELVVPLSPSATLASTLAPLVRRTLPVQLPPQLAPSHEARTLRLVAPAGYRFAPLPAGGDENGGDFGRASLSVARDAKDPRVVVVKRALVFELSLVPVERYAAWRSWLQRVDALMHRTVRLVPEAEGGGPR